MIRSVGLWRWYINITITILAIIHSSVFYLNTMFQRVDTISVLKWNLLSRTETEASSIYWAQLSMFHLKPKNPVTDASCFKQKTGRWIMSRIFIIKYVDIYEILTHGGVRLNNRDRRESRKPVCVVCRTPSTSYIAFSKVCACMSLWISNSPIDFRRTNSDYRINNFIIRKDTMLTTTFESNSTNLAWKVLVKYFGTEKNPITEYF
jgi:hypothetical protein